MQWHQLSTPNNAKEKLWMEGIAQVSKLAQDIPKQGHRAYALTFGACLHWALRIRWLLDSCVDHIISEITSILNRFHRQDEASYFVSMVPGRRCLPHASSRNSTDKKIIDMVTWSWNVGALQPSSRLNSTLHLQERLWGRRTWAVSHIHFWKVNPNASKCHLYDNDSNSCLTAMCEIGMPYSPEKWSFQFTRTCTMPLPSMYIRSLATCFEHNDTPTSARAHTHMLYTHTKQIFRSVSLCWGLKAPSSTCSCKIRKALGTSVVCCILCLVIIRLCTTSKLRKLCDSCRNLVNLVQLRIWGHISSWHISYLQRIPPEKVPKVESPWLEGRDSCT